MKTPLPPSKDRVPVFRAVLFCVTIFWTLYSISSEGADSGSVHAGRFSKDTVEDFVLIVLPVTIFIVLTIKMFMLYMEENKTDRKRDGESTHFRF